MLNEAFVGCEIEESVALSLGRVFLPFCVVGFRGWTGFVSLLALCKGVGD